MAKPSPWEETLGHVIRGMGDQTPQLPTAAQAVAATGPAGRYDAPTGSYLPWGVSVPQNMQQAAQHQPWDLTWFKNMVQGGGPWDFKPLAPDPKSFEHRALENAGNFNFGATGTALGLPQWLLDRAAGAYQIYQHGYDPARGNPFGAAPYGDDPRDQWEINRGIGYAKRHPAR